jgi:hypothetical protein
MTAAEFTAAWDRRCEIQVQRDLVQFDIRRRKVVAADPLRWVEYWRIWDRYQAKADALAERAVAELGWPLEKALDAAHELMDLEREREYEVAGFNEGVR